MPTRTSTGRTTVVQSIRSAALGEKLGYKFSCLDCGAVARYLESFFVDTHGMAVHKAVTHTCSKEKTNAGRDAQRSSGLLRNA